MFGKSPLTRALASWVKQGGDLDDLVSPYRDRPVKSKAEAGAIGAALDALRAKRDRDGNDGIDSALHTLTAFFQQVETPEAFDALQQDGLPRLRAWVRDHLEGQDVRKGEILFILKILAMYRQRQDVDLIAQAARKPVDADGFMWSVIFNQFDNEHPYSVDMVEALRDPLPTHFILVAYLDLANRLAIEGRLDRHPFDSELGRQQLESWLRDENEATYSYAHSATAALPFIAPSSREGLLRAAASHPDPSVRMEAAWAQAKSGDPAGLERLAEFCRDPRHSHNAQKYLEELGHAERIPEEARSPESRAVAEMACWLAHPNEFGRPPDTLELLDTRELYWPPTDDRRRLSLVKYTYADRGGGEPDSGVGMVGSVTFALFGETTADLSPEDIYGLHCCWELEIKGDSRSPHKRTATAGRQILRRHNAGF